LSERAEGESHRKRRKGSLIGSGGGGGGVGVWRAADETGPRADIEGVSITM